MDVVCTHIQAPVTFKPMPASTSAEVCMARTRYINPQVTIKTDTTSYTQINLSYNCTSVYPTAHYFSFLHAMYSFSAIHVQMRAGYVLWKGWGESDRWEC